MPNKSEPTLPNNIREEAKRILSKLYSVEVQPCEPFAESFEPGTLLVELSEAIQSGLNHSKVKAHVKACYQEALFAVQDKFLYIDKVANLNLLEKEYDKLTETIFKNHPTLSAKERKPIYEMISYYRAMFKQCFLLHQLANLGGDLHVLDKQNHVLESESSDNAIRANQGLAAKEELKKALKTLNAEFVPANAQVKQYEKSLQRSLEHYRDEENYNFASLQEPFHNFKNEFFVFLNRVNKFKSTLSEKSNFIRLPLDFELSIKKLKDELKLIAKVNILNCSEVIKSPDNFPKRIADLSIILQRYKDAFAEKENASNVEAQQLLEEYNRLKNALAFLHEDAIEKVRAYQLELKRQSVTKVLPPVPRAELDFTDAVGEVKTARDQVNAAFTCLKKVKVNLVLQQSNVELFMKKLRNEGKGKLVDLLYHLNVSNALEKNNIVFEKAADVFKEKLGKESAWSNVVTMIDKSKAFSADILALQKACHFPNQVEHEIAALEKDLIGRTQELGLKQKEVMKRIDPYIEGLQNHDENISALRGQVNQQLEDLFNREMTTFTNIQLAVNSNCEALASEIQKFKFDAEVPKTNIKLDYPEEVHQIEKQLLQIKDIYAGHLKKLDHAEHSKNKSEVDAICDRSKINSPIQPSEKNFFSRHWGKILALTSTSAAIGAGTGLMLGLLSAAPTLGFGTIAFTAIGFCAGALVGGVSGILGAVIFECTKHKKEIPKPVTPTVTEELEPPIRSVSSTPTIAPVTPMCTETVEDILKGLKECTQRDEGLSFRRSYN